MELIITLVITLASVVRAVRDTVISSLALLNVVKSLLQLRKR